MMRALGSAVLTAVLYAAVCAVAYRLALHLTGPWHAQSATLGALWAGIAVLIGMAAASQHPDLAPWLNGSLRLAEAAVGMATAVVLSLLARPIEHLRAASKRAAGPG